MSDSDFYRLLLNYERWEELLGFRTSGQDKSRYIFKIIDMLPYKFPAFEFILFKGRQGIKVYEFNYETDEAGIDYEKLERPLLPADLEGFSKAALRIWRNAIYARHGRIFKSEDLQALFNEYTWYTPDENYSDDKLTDTDLANIKLIQEFEEK